ncbi:MAG: hypothetical protein INH37_00445 [Myxococcaceae bacterium]|nr:hypothetical protein [Myxococcaceae bacterium]
MLTDALVSLRKAMTPARLVSRAARASVQQAAIELACGDVHDEAAFERLLIAVDVFHEAERRRRREAPPVVPWGPRAGQPITSCNSAELERLEAALTAALHNATKAQFREANLSLRGAVLAELRRRKR